MSALTMILLAVAAWYAVRTLGRFAVWCIDAAEPTYRPRRVRR